MPLLKVIECPCDDSDDRSDDRNRTEEISIAQSASILRYIGRIAPKDKIYPSAPAGAAIVDAVSIGINIFIFSYMCTAVCHIYHECHAHH